MEIGKPNALDIDKYCEIIEQMVLADEVRFAYQMLENVPGYYRDFPHPKLIELKKKLNNVVFSIEDYLSDQDEFKPPSDYNDISHAPRNEELRKVVEQYNKLGISPHILEFGPFDYWVPHGLKKMGMKFSYNSISLIKDNPNRPMKELMASSHVIFICFEVIEHMWRPEDVKQMYDQKCNYDPDVVMFSTPRYTMGGGLTEIKWNRFGHLRTWTPSEFVSFCFKEFGNTYNWHLTNCPMMVCTGIKQGSEIEVSV